MKLDVLFKEVQELIKEAISKGINPENINVYLYDSKDEVILDEITTELYLNIQEDDIPYDSHGYDVIYKHTNVVIIRGE